jgi:hypothetical protein
MATIRLSRTAARGTRNPAVVTRAGTSNILPSAVQQADTARNLRTPRGVYSDAGCIRLEVPG